MNSKKNKKSRHDLLFRKAMQNPIAAREMIHTHLPPELLQIIDTESLKLEKESYVEPNLRHRISDVLFSVKFKDQDGYVWALLEHQSRPDKWMAFRLFKYMLNICDHYLKNNPKTQSLPLIYPAIIYNGTRKYNASRNLWNLFNLPELAKLYWAGDHKVVDLQQIPDEELKQQLWAGTLQFFLKHIHQRNLLNKWHEIADLLPEIVKVKILGREYIEMLLFYTLTKIEKNDKIELQKLLDNKLNPQNSQEIMGSLAQHWMEEGIEIGEAKGIEKGIEKGKIVGITEGKAELIKTMLKNGSDIQTISKLLGMSVTEIRKLIS